jgi:hypothetical protein
MKTAEEYLKIWQGEEVEITKDVAIMAMKEYAKQVADQALKDAVRKVTLLYESDATGKIGHYGSIYGTETGEVKVDKESILSTPIQTP